MFLDDEQAYQRLRRHETAMGWLAISAVAALVFMFAGLMNSASAKGPYGPSLPAQAAGHHLPSHAPGTPRVIVDLHA